MRRATREGENKNGGSKPGDQDDAQTVRAAAALLARILDTMIPIPGTRFRIGLDPLLGLIPGVGDALANLIGSMIIMMAAKLRVPKIVLARMSLNVLLNGVIGAIPVIGDLFSAWFRSNVRNAELLARATEFGRRSGATSDWIFVVGIVVVTLGMVALAAFAIISLIIKMWQAMN